MMDTRINPATLAALPLVALLLTGATALVAPPPAAAQGAVVTRAAEDSLAGSARDSTMGSIVGTVVDSTSGGRPLEAATIQVVLRDRPEIAFGATSDRAGAFRIADVPPGAYLATFFHPRLDSLFLEAPTYLATVGEGATTLSLAIPAPSSIVAASCGTAPSDSSGLFFGRVRDADERSPIAGATVSVAWHEVVIDRLGLRQARRQLAAVSNDDGRFAICGIPTDTDVIALAELGPDATGALTVRVPPRGLLHRELLMGRGEAALTVADVDSLVSALGVAPRRGTARLTGIVRKASGQPFANARVAVHGAMAADTTGADGRFVLDGLPAGTHTLEVRAIGYSPERLTVDLASGRTDTAVVTVAERLATLDAVTVYGTARPRRGRLDEFLDRRKRGMGRYITAEDIERRQPFDVTDLFRTMAGVRVVPKGGWGSAVEMRGCAPTVFLDGMRMWDGSQDISTLVSPQLVAGIEVYSSPATTPIQFKGGGNCGVIVIWTKGGF